MTGSRWDGMGLVKGHWEQSLGKGLILLGGAGNSLFLAGVVCSSVAEVVCDWCSGPNSSRTREGWDSIGLRKDPRR